MEITANNLKVLEHGCIVLSKDSAMDFILDANHTITLQFIVEPNENPGVKAEEVNENHLKIICKNFGENGLSQGLKKPLSVLKLGSGNHFFLQFAVSYIGASRVVFYSWFTEIDAQRE